MTNFMAVQFGGEDDWDAIVNHACFDIEEEAEFEKFLIANGESRHSPLETLEYWLEEWLTPPYPPHAYQYPPQ